MNHNTQAAGTPDAGTLLGSVVSALIAKADPGTMQTLLADTALSGAVTAALAKAHERLEGEGIKQIEDQWDGSPNDRPMLRRTRPGGSMAEGMPVGRGESMRGGNAETMGGAYSDYAPQGGQFQAYEHFGRALGSVRKSVLALVDVAQVAKAQQDVTSAAITAINTRFDEITKSLAVLTEAVAKAQPAAAAAAAPAAKAEEKDEKKDKDEGKDNPFAKSMLDNIAKSLAAAEAAVIKGLEAKVAGDVAKAEEHGKEAKDEMAKATTLVETAKSVDAGLVSADLLASIVKSQERIALLAAPAAKSEATKDGNQKEWPASKEAAKAAENAANMGAIMERIEKALSGVATLRTDMSGLMGALGNRSRNPDGLPPAFELAKATPDVMKAKRDAISKMYADGDLSDEEHDKASDLMARVEAAAKGNLPEAIVLNGIANAPAPVRALFVAQAA